MEETASTITNILSILSCKLSGFIGIVSRTSPRSWIGFSSMQMTGSDSSKGCSYKSKMSSIQAAKSAFCCGGMHQHLRRRGFNSFFERGPTASWDVLSIYCNSMALSASSRNDDRDRPSGGVLQPRAMILASTSPVILGITGGASLFFRLIATSKPFSEYRRRIVWRVC